MQRKQLDRALLPLIPDRWRRRSWHYAAQTGELLLDRAPSHSSPIVGVADPWHYAAQTGELLLDRAPPHSSPIVGVADPWHYAAQTVVRQLDHTSLPRSHGVVGELPTRVTQHPLVYLCFFFPVHCSHESLS
ncbi:hypothetical protein BLNAU_25180 [Blattamonas nauphoetae]|uniref:Uncharacterized protein n=1 Tax=Blattamonas nauphoetae TaxID=2049346 RepID=A0ABQ9WKC2_9EUKA|nr:hypothetical protein BLNAU_25180 [Blattamonas nauphoetae]